MKTWIERRTGLLFNTYRPHITDATMRDTWLVIAPARPGRMFSVVIGSRGFCIGRWER